MGTAYTVQSRGESKVMIPYPNYRILRVHRNSRVESAGKHVRWLRLRDADLAVSVSRRRVNVHLFLHGKFASERLWLRRRDCGVVNSRRSSLACDRGSGGREGAGTSGTSGRWPTARKGRKAIRVRIRCASRRAVSAEPHVRPLSLWIVPPSCEEDTPVWSGAWRLKASPS